MYIMNSVLNVILSAFFVVQAALSLPFSSVIFRIDTDPSVFESGDGMYTVIWSTSLPGTGYVTYSYGGEDYTVNDEKSGLIRSTDTVHSVRVPKEHLDGNSYACHSQQVGTKRAYTAIKGRTVSTDETAFTGYTGQEKIRALVLSDIHENIDGAEKAAKNFDASPDIIVINGDAVSTMTSVIKIKQILSYAHRLSKGSIPVIYTRGNHENRGEYSPELVDLFKTTTGGLYFECSYGPVNFLCLDTGEDKEDSHSEYSGLVDFEAYIARETQWLESLTPDEAAQNRICFAHIPRMYDRYGFNWIPLLERLGIELAVFGHKHTLFLEPTNKLAKFYQIIDGGKDGEDNYIATMLTIYAGRADALSFDSKGEKRGEYSYDLTTGPQDLAEPA